MLRGEKGALREGERADALDGFDEDEECGDEGDGAPTDLFEDGRGAGAGADEKDGRDGDCGDEGGEAEIFAEGGGGEQNGDNESEADEDELAVSCEGDGVG